MVGVYLSLSNEMRCVMLETSSSSSFVYPKHYQQISLKVPSENKFLIKKFIAMKALIPMLKIILKGLYPIELKIIICVQYFSHIIVLLSRKTKIQFPMVCDGSVGVFAIFKSCSLCYILGSAA